MHYLSFGEILFDVFPYGAKLGGAPLNVAAHMEKLGNNGFVVSALGKDALGERALREMKALGVDTSLIALTDYETGRADIILQNGDADYTFNASCAWDHITLSGSLPEKVDVLYFGTLALRSKESEDTLDTILSSVKADYIFYDVNLRKHFYTRELIQKGLKAANILKVNEEELPVVLSVSGIRERDRRKAVPLLAEKENLDVVLVTLGKDGSSSYSKGIWYEEKANATSVVDTVGAGDSLSAGFLSSYVLHQDPKRALSLGARIADYVVTQEGAIPSYGKELMETIRKEIRWKEDGKPTTSDPDVPFSPKESFCG